MGGGDSLTSSVVQTTVAAAAIGVGVGLLIGTSWRRAELEAERRERKAEHDGRVRLQRSLRPTTPFGRPSAASGGESDGVAFIKSVSDTDDGESGLGDTKKIPRKRVNELGPPIGRVHSCFSRRNGTPRQGGDLVPNARCTFTLDDDLPKDLLAGLDEYSHCWVIYVFHANTNAGDTRNGGAVKAKVHVPRLDGASVGALATRTPHRPLPVGLSIGRVVALDVRMGTLTLAGADVVDGTPVLDIKPYVPFCDCVPKAVAPGWVGREATDRDEPLKIARVEIANRAKDEVVRAYVESAKERRKRRLASTAIAKSSKGSSSFGECRGAVGGGGGGGNKARDKGKQNKPNDSLSALTEEEIKRRKKEEKDRRRSGLMAPDALYASGEEFLSMAQEVLALDMRTVRERQAPQEKKKFSVYHVTLCDVELDYTVDANRIVTLVGGRAVPPVNV